MTGKLRLIIAGSRTVDPTDEEIERVVEELVIDFFGARHGDLREHGHTQYIEEVICGKADGADAAGARWARGRGIPVFEDPVTEDDRRKHGPYMAPKARNRRMAERGTHAICWWDGSSGGTADIACRMLARRKPCVVIPTRKRPARQRARKPKSG